jgi:hypothetical protein
LKNRCGNTPLHLALEKGNKELITTLLEHQADVSIRGSKGKTFTELIESNEHAKDKEHYLTLIKQRSLNSDSPPQQPVAESEKEEEGIEETRSSRESLRHVRKTLADIPSTPISSPPTTLEKVPVIKSVAPSERRKLGNLFHHPPSKVDSGPPSPHPVPIVPNSSTSTTATGTPSSGTTPPSPGGTVQSAKVSLFLLIIDYIHFAYAEFAWREERVAQNEKVTNARLDQKVHFK